MLRLLEKFIGRASLMIRCTASPVRDIISSAAADSELSGLAFITAMNNELEQGECDIRQLWSEKLKAYPPYGINEEEFSVLDIMGRTLGAADIQGQLDCLEMYGGIIASSIKEADKERKEKPKLFRSMGLLAGLFAAVILI